MKKSEFDLLLVKVLSDVYEKYCKELDEKVADRKKVQGKEKKSPKGKK
ncbi:MAG: hypothetical protein J6A50_05190 [Clostridia bacterium]|nr:hypothetical protein [Clostridia bacterium]